MYGPSGVFPREILKSRRSQRASILHFEFTHRNYSFLKSQSPHLQSYKLIDVAHVSYHIRLLTVSTPHRLRLLTISDSLPSQTISDKLGTIRDSLPYKTPFHLRLLVISDRLPSQIAHYLRLLPISDRSPSHTASHLSFPSKTAHHLILLIPSQTA